MSNARQLNPKPESRQEKYSALEIERRWLAGAEAIRLVEGSAYREMEDLYVAGTSMRLRAVRSLGQQPVFKLCKKYGKSKEGFSEAITNLYLSEAEHRLLVAQLRGIRVLKRRYALSGGALDVYAGPPQTVVFELEFASEAEAAAYSPPGFVGQEVTHAQAFSGAAIAAAHVER
jgi:CYTH domain-containing protein